MHHPRHSRIIRNFRLAACLLILKRLVLIAVIPCCVAGILAHRHAWVLTGLSLILLGIILGVLQRIFAASAKCPLCMMPPLGRSGCVKHRRVRSLFGSKRSLVAISILFRGWFRCPYCNEPTEMSLKSGHHSG